MHKKFIVGIRTNKFDTQSKCLYDYYKEQNIQVVFIFDETKHEVDTKGYLKLSLNNEFLKKNGLFANIDKVGWLCGDYCLYLMMLSYPEHDGFWLIEDDAFIKHSDIKSFFQKPFDLKVDFAIARLAQAHKHWRFLDACKSYFNLTQVCIGLFSVVFISRECCENAYNERVKFTKYFLNHENKPVFLNDEAFMINSPFMKKYNMMNLIDLYPEISFKNFNFSSISPITKISHYKNMNDGAYHPVVLRSFHLKDYFLRLKKISKKKNIFKEELISEIKFYSKKINLKRRDKI